jgi:hypothetical protein
MKITKRQLAKIIKEEKRKLFEDSIADELDHLRNNMEDDKKHIDNLESDIEDDREELEHAHDAEKEKNESVRHRRRLRQIIYRAINEDQGYDAHEDESLGMRTGPESEHTQDDEDRREDSYGKWGTRDDDDHVVHHHHHHHHDDDQGYDDREDEHLAAEHGAAAEHEQDYQDRRDDAGFEVQQEARRKRSYLRRQLRKTVQEQSRPSQQSVRHLNRSQLGSLIRSQVKKNRY